MLGSSILACNIFVGQCQEKRQCKPCRSQQQSDKFSLPFQRRDLLLKSSVGLPLLFHPKLAQGCPISPPDMMVCKEKDGLQQGTCCLPPIDNSAMKDFVPPVSPILRVRKAAHLLDDAYAQKLNRAYEILNNLDNSDLRKKSHQANIHCVFCDHRYKDTSIPTRDFDIHGSWFFFPWHRMYLYFHEKILQDVLQDPTFSLPFWNWDNQSDSTPAPNVFPQIYGKGYEYLYDPRRANNRLHLVPRLRNPNPDVSGTKGGGEELRAENNSVMYSCLVQKQSAIDFMGPKYSARADFKRQEGSLESAPHNAVHYYTGGETGDMGHLATAAKDPVFFAHHSNVDRLWWIWKHKVGGLEWADPDFLDASFAFFDEKGRPVKAYVRDFLDIEKLGYSYEDMPITWRESGPCGIPKRNPLEDLPVFGKGKSHKLDSPFSSTVVPQEVSISPGSSGNRTVLVLEGIEFPHTTASGFDVFVNLTNANKDTPLHLREYAGTFQHLPHKDHDDKKESTVRMSIGATLDLLGIKRGERFNLTLVPHNDPITFTGIVVDQEQA